MQQQSLRRILLSAVIGLVLYANGALLLNRMLLSMSSSIRLPVGFFVGGLFNLYPVFASYEGENTEIILRGLPESAPDPAQESDWISLPTQDYFPFRLGEQHAKILGANRGSEDPLTTQAFLARKVRERHNRLHATRIRRVRIRMERWPRSEQGYRAAKSPATTTMTDLFTEE